MEEILKEGLAALGLPDQAVPALVRYGELLQETNKVMNLTAITAPADIARLHFLDSAVLLTLEDFKDKSVLDVGTGAGFPGLVLRILEPTVRLTLLDALQKRIHFLETVCRELQLTDVWPAYTAGRRNLPRSTGSPLTWSPPAPWQISRFWRSCASPW